MIARLPCLLISVLSGVALSQGPQAAGRKGLEPIQSALTYHTPDYRLHLRAILMRKAPARCDVEAEPAKQQELLVRLAKEMDRLELLLATTSSETGETPGGKEPKRKGA